MAASTETPRTGSHHDLSNDSESTGEKSAHDSIHEEPPPDAVADEKSTEHPLPDPDVKSVAPSDDGYLPKSKLWPVFACIYVAIILVGLDRTVLTTAIPQITNAFNALDDVEWFAGAYMLTVSCFMLLYGRLYGYYSPKWIFIISIFIFEVGSAICGASPNADVFIFGRAIAGLGGAGAFSGAMIIIMHTVPLHKRPMYTGFLGSAMGISSIAGPLIGGAFTSSSATWRWCFYLNLPVGGVALVVIAYVLPNIPVGPGGEKPLREQLLNLDPFGLIFFLPSMVCLILALQWGGSQYAWSSGRIIALLTVFAVTLVTFVAVQIWRGEMATVPPRFIKMRSIAASAWFSFANSSSMFALVYFLPLYFQSIQGVSAVQSGIRTLPLVISLILFSMGAGVGVRILGYYVPFMFASTVISAIGCGLLTTLRPDSNMGEWIGYQVLFGAGLGLGMQQGGVAAQTVLSKKDASIGISVVFFAQQLGGAVWVAVAQNLFEQKLASGLSQIPGFDVGSLANVGATDLRNLVSPELLPQVLEIYCDALDVAFQSALGIVCAGVIGAVFVEWKSTKRELKEKEAAKKQAEAKA